jgi:hypothetical protein
MIMKRIVDSSLSDGRGVRPFRPVSNVTTNGASPDRQAAKKISPQMKIVPSRPPASVFTRRLTILEFSGAPLLARPLQRGVGRRWRLGAHRILLFNESRASSIDQRNSFPKRLADKNVDGGKK